MTYAGARVDTARQISDVFGFDLDQTRFHPAFSQLIEHINTIGEFGGIRLSTANGIWPQAGYGYLETFLEIMLQYYGSKITPLDYQDAAGARKQINTWTSKATNNMIKELIPKGILNNLTRMVLTNAIYF